MNLANIEKITFKVRKMTVSGKIGSKEDNLLISYDDHKTLREKILDFTVSVVKSFPDYFSFYCSQCGNCCKRNNIYVKGGDLFSISTHLELDEKEIRNKYINPVNSWSSYDGYLKLENGRCPFLEELSTGKYICKIYDCRPLDCNLYLPTSQACQKEATELIEQIYSIEIKGEKINLTLKNGHNYNASLPVEVKEKYKQILKILSSIKPGEANRVKTVLKEVENILQDIEEEKISRDSFKKNISRLKKIIQNIWKDSVSYSEDIEKTWKKICHMEMKYIDKILEYTPDTAYLLEEEEKEAENLLSISNFSLNELTLYPLNMLLNYTVKEETYNYLVNYPKNNNTLKLVRSLTDNIITYIKKNSPIILDNFIPKCYMCGTCCSIFKVEIEPSDIKRIAGKLNMSEEEFRDKFILPSRYSWNPGSGIIKKKAEEKTGRQICVFLEKGPLNLDYCSIHEFKPDLCRKYKSGKVHCYSVIEASQNYRLIDNLHSITINSRNINVSTAYTCFKMGKPFIIKWKNYKNLKKDIEKIIFSLEKILRENYSFNNQS